jgi:hypothetical protein
MSFLKNVIRDLVEKRLWPVAIALVAALVAVPIVLGGQSDATTSTAIPATTTNSLANHRDVARATVVSLEEQAAGKVERPGAVRDPFVQHHQPKTVAEKVAAAVTTTKTLADALSGSSGSSGSSSSSGSSDTTTTDTKTTSTPTKTTTTNTTTTTTPKAASDDTYRVKFSFGESGAQKTYDNVARLTPLPSADNPFFVYLGLQADQKHAVFLVASDAVPSGDGACQPSATDCEQVVLAVGDTEFFELQSGTAGVVQYELDLKGIEKVKASTKAKAAVAHARESKAGREYLRELVADDPDALSAYSYNKGRGLLVAAKDPVATPDVANVPAGVADAATGQAVEQTSTVLTVPSSTTP